MILVYTGEGKGKTSACTGQAVRAHGHGLVVGFVQFMKLPEKRGEQKILSELLGDRYFSAGGRGFFRNEADRPEHRAAALASLARARELVESVDMLVLDESLYALGCGLLLDAELDGLIRTVRMRDIHLVLSGRGLPPHLRDEADLVTEMAAVKHPFMKGLPAVCGVDF